MTKKDIIISQKETKDDEVWILTEGVGTNMEEDDYKELYHICLQGGGREMTEDEAKKFIYKEVGFDPALITIINTAATFEHNPKTCHIRKVDEYERKPLYSATDWNYVRFDCRGWQWEIVNGELYQYAS